MNFNPFLQNLPTYLPGRPIEEVAREMKIPASSIIKLASNENPLGPSPKALAALRQVLPQIHLYPDGQAYFFKHKLADSLGIEVNQLILGNGSNELIEFAAHALLSPGSEVVVSQYCFAIYPIVAKMFGAGVVTVPARNYGHDLQAMLEAITPQTRIVFVANPNNPTGTMALREELIRFVNEVPQNVLVVLDEAYIEFLDDPVDFTGLIRLGTCPNVMLMRTFSKIHGLAGLRVGYGMGPAPLIAAFEKIRQPFNLNLPAQVAAAAALEDVEHVQKTRINNFQGLEYLSAGFRRLGLEYVPSHANFIMVKVGRGQFIFEAMQRRGVIVRPMGGYLLPEWIRVSVGLPQENERCLAALHESLKS